MSSKETSLTLTSMNSNGSHQPIEISPENLAAETLQEVLSQFIFREGTDYGPEELSLEVKLTRLNHQLADGHIKIVFDPDTESVTLMTSQDFRKMTRQT